jgi:hypothetical protein
MYPRGGWYDFFAPAKTPANIVDRCSKAQIAAVKTSGFQPKQQDRRPARAGKGTGCQQPGV